jgi:hypothetical protein
MTDMALQGSPALPSSTRPNLDKGFNPITAIIFIGVLAADSCSWPTACTSTSTRPAPR